MPRTATTTSTDLAVAHPDLAANLRLLCSFKPSIADVGRALGVNRSQLNKYLSGNSQPRPALLRRIGDHFGVEVHELVMPPQDFAELMRTRAAPRTDRSRTLALHLEQLIEESDPRAFDLAGSYFEYYRSMSTPGYILRSLIVFEEREGAVYYKRLERIGMAEGSCRRHYVYQGVALMLGDRIMLTDYESGLRIEVTQTILYPDYSKALARLQGVKLGISANRQRTPCAARVLLERTPPRAGLLSSLRKCGLYPEDTLQLAAHIRASVDNGASGPHHFLSHPSE